MKLVSLSLTIAFACFMAGAQTVLQMDMGFFNANPTTNRTITLQAQSPFVGNLLYAYSDPVTGTAFYTNPPAGLVNCVILAPPAKINFQVWITNNGSLINASNCLVNGQGGTYPAGSVSWSIATSDQRYQFAGTTLSNNFYPLYSNPSNYVNNVTLLSASNGIVGNLPQLTNGQTTIVYSNPAIFASQVQATNIANSVYSNNLALYVTSSTFVAGTNTVAQNASAALIATNTAITANTLALVNPVSNSVVVASNLLSNGKQPASGILTNLSVTGANTNAYIAGQNLTLTTNLGIVTVNATNQNFLTNGFVTAIITNGFLTTNGAYLLYYPTSNPSLFVTATVTNGLATTNYVNASALVVSNALLGLIQGTNGFVTASITNGLATISYVNQATNSTLTNALAYFYPTSNPSLFVSSIVTNGLATIPFVQSQITVSNQALASLTTNQINSASNALITTAGGFIQSSNTANLIITTNLVVASTNAGNIVFTNNPKFNLALTNAGAFVASANGQATNLTGQGVFIFGTKTNFVYSTNLMSLTISGSLPSGTWVGNGNLLTNPFYTNLTISTSGGVWLAISNGVTMYSSVGGLTWTTVSGIAPVPIGSFGHYDYDNGTVYNGWIYSTNINWQITNGSENASLFGVVGGLVNSNSFTSTGSNVILNIIGQSESGPTNGIPVLNGFGTNTTIITGKSIASTNVAFSIVSQISPDAPFKFMGNYFVFGNSNNMELTQYSANGFGMGIVGGFSNIIHVPSGGLNSYIFGGKYINMFYGGIATNNNTWFTIGGISNTVTGSGAANNMNACGIVGGTYNVLDDNLNITGQPQNSIIVGGSSNVIYAQNSFTLGQNITITNWNTLVENDGTPVYTVTNNQAILYYTNGVSINTNNPSGFTLNVAGSVNATNFFVNGNPAGQIFYVANQGSTLPVAIRPAICYTLSAGQFVKTNSTYDNNGWFQQIADHP